MAGARTADVAAGMATMPRFEDGCTSLQELPGQLAESVVNEMMGAGSVGKAGVAASS